MSAPAAPHASVVGAQRHLARPHGRRRAVLTAGLTALVFWLAYDSGSYQLLSRTSLGILIWWVIAVGVAVGLWPRAYPTTSAFAIAGILAAFSGWTTLSIAWAANDQAAFDETGRTLLYLGVFVLVVLTAPLTGVRPWTDALAFAVTLIVVLALASRFFPGTFTSTSQYRFLSFGQSRLNYPIGYWNGLAIFVMLGLPLLLRLAVAPPQRLLRAAAVAVVPGASSVVYLASSRGGVAAGIVGTAAFLALNRRRIHSLVALAAGLAGSVAAVAVLHSRSTLVDDPGAAAAVSQGRQAAVLLVVISILTAGAYAGAELLLARMPPSARRERYALFGLAAVLVIAVIVANPSARFHEFKSLPTSQQGTSVGSHLTSGSGNGRWQYWQTAFEEFKAHPLNGGGAGSFAEWWTQHRPIAAFALDAHSLYVETLGELGVIGLALMLGLVGMALYVAVARPLGVAGDNGVAAALGAALIAYLVAAGIDWMWELTVVTVVGLVLLALLASPPSSRAPAFVPGVAIRIAVGATAVVAILVQLSPLVATQQLRDSQTAVRRVDPKDALAAAHDARRAEPWAYGPYLQLALVHEQLGQLRPARDAIESAVSRDDRNWQLWLVKARLQAKSGDIAGARRSLRRVRELNPLGFIPS